MDSNQVVQEKQAPKQSDLEEQLKQSREAAAQSAMTVQQLTRDKAALTALVELLRVQLRRMEETAADLVVQRDEAQRNLRSIVERIRA